MTYLGSRPHIGSRPHLGSRLSALVDGQLSAAAADDALAHVAACQRCAEELGAARAARDLLAATAWTAPSPDPALTARLLAMRAAPPVRPGDPFAGQTVRLDGAGSSGTGALGGSGSPYGTLGGGRGPVWATGSLASLALVVTVLFLLGARPDVAPVDHSGVPLALGDDSAQPVAALVDLDALRTDGWTVPVLPLGWDVTAAAVREGVLELDLAGPDGAAVVVTEQRGMLSRSLVAALPTQDVGGRTVQVVSYQPWAVVWQAGDTVVGVVVADVGTDAEAIVAAFPAGAYDDGVPARLARGWTSLASLLH